MRSIDDPELARNYGFWSPAEQQRLLSADVALAGVGGDGYLLGLSLVRMGVGALRIADPEVFEAENVNRVPGAVVPNLGRPKVDCFVEDALAINPELKLEVFPEGVTPFTVEPFLRGADLVVDETELTRLEIGTLIADHAERSGIPDLQVMNVGFAAQVTSFHPTAGGGFRDMIGVDADAPLNAVARVGLDLRRVLPVLPRYLDLAVVEAVEGGAPLPSVVPGVNLASALGASQAFLHLVAGAAGSRRPEPVWYPEILYLDSLTGESRWTRDTVSSHDRTRAQLEADNAARLVTSLTYPLTP